MANSPDHPPDSEGVQEIGDDEDTLAEGEWPVADQYRVEPAPHAGPERTEVEEGAEGTVVLQQRSAAPSGPVRRFPPDLGPGLLAVLVAVLLLIPAAVWLASNASDEDEPTATGTSGTTTDTTTPSATRPPALRAVPDVAGVRLVEARSLLDDAGFRAQVRFEPSDRPEGEILGQAPRGGEDARPNAIVVLTVSGGPEQITVPDVEGLTADGASRALRAAGLQPEIRLVRSKEAAGTVLEQAPAADEEVDPGSVVQLEVAEAAPEPATIEVPDVIGVRAADARRELRELGLRSTVAKVASGDPKGTVVGQSPGAGAKLREGATVRLRVSAGPAQVTVPDVTGLDEESARQQLEAAGFDVQIVDEPTADATQDGLVVSQTPTGGTRGEKGSRVTLSIARFA